MELLAYRVCLFSDNRKGLKLHSSNLVISLLGENMAIILNALTSYTVTAIHLQA